MGLTLAGAVVGAVWAWLAPPIQLVIALTRSGDRVRGYVGDESDLLFLGAFVMTGLLFVVAVTAAVAVWQWRPHRGPLAVGALSVGALAAAGAAAGVGAGLARWRYGVIDVAAAPISPEHRVFYVHQAPAVFFGHSAAADRGVDRAARGSRGAGLRDVRAVGQARRSGCVATHRGGLPGARPSRLLVQLRQR